MVNTIVMLGLETLRQATLANGSPKIGSIRKSSPFLVHYCWQLILRICRNFWDFCRIFTNFPELHQRSIWFFILYFSVIQPSNQLVSIWIWSDLRGYNLLQFDSITSTVLKCWVVIETADKATWEGVCYFTPVLQFVKINVTNLLSTEWLQLVPVGTKHSAGSLLA